MKYYLNLAAMLVLAVTLWGIIFPAMISMPDSFVVIGGYALIIAYFPLMYYWIKQIKGEK
jgi:hypothetical protein